MPAAALSMCLEEAIRPAPREETPKRVLIDSPAAIPDLRTILTELNWAALEVCTWREARSFFGHDRVPIIITEIRLPDGDWKDMLASTREMTSPPNVVITNRLSDERLWAEVLNLGGYDVLVQPFRRDEVAFVLDAALRNWRQRQPLSWAPHFRNP